MKDEALLVPIEDRIAENIRREQIAGKLNALKAECERAGECLRESRLADTGDIFNQQVAAREQASDGEHNRLGFPNDDFTNLFGECIDAFLGTKTICRIAFICKRGEVHASRGDYGES